MLVVVPTDKTNSFQVVHTRQYVKWMGNQLTKTAIHITKRRLGEVYDDAICLLIESKDFLSANEYNYILEITPVQCLPQTIDQGSQGPSSQWRSFSETVSTRCNLCTGFPNVGYQGLKKILDDWGINYSKHTIIQALKCSKRSWQTSHQQGQAQGSVNWCWDDVSFHHLSDG